MKREWPRGGVANAMLAALLFASSPFGSNEIVAHASAQHAAHSGPANMQAELDNQQMVVFRVRMAPHERTGMHDVSPRLVIWLTDAYLRDTKPDGTTTEYRRAAGSTEWVPAQQHAGENLSDNPIEFLAVVPKPSRSAPR